MLTRAPYQPRAISGQFRAGLSHSLSQKREFCEHTLSPARERALHFEKKSITRRQNSEPCVVWDSIPGVFYLPVFFTLKPRLNQSAAKCP